MEDDLKKIRNGRRPQKNEKNGRRPKKKTKKKLFSIPLKFKGKPFLGLAQLSKIFYLLLLFIYSVNIKPPRHRFGFSLACGWQKSASTFTFNMLSYSHCYSKCKRNHSIIYHYIYWLGFPLVIEFN
jgi:hypothetical protein